MLFCITNNDTALRCTPYRASMCIIIWSNVDCPRLRSMHIGVDRSGSPACVSEGNDTAVGYISFAEDNLQRVQLGMVFPRLTNDFLNKDHQGILKRSNSMLPEREEYFQYLSSGKPPHIPAQNLHARPGLAGQNGRRALGLPGSLQSFPQFPPLVGEGGFGESKLSSEGGEVHPAGFFPDGAFRQGCHARCHLHPIVPKKVRGAKLNLDTKWISPGFQNQAFHLASKLSTFPALRTLAQGCEEETVPPPRRCPVTTLAARIVRRASCTRARWSPSDSPSWRVSGTRAEPRLRPGTKAFETSRLALSSWRCCFTSRKVSSWCWSASHPQTTRAGRGFLSDVFVLGREKSALANFPSRSSRRWRTSPCRPSTLRTLFFHGTMPVCHGLQ